MNLKVREKTRELLNISPAASQRPERPESHNKIGLSPTQLISLFGIHLAIVNKQYHKN